ncbi:MAG TPA: hydroxyethylthiazole kinase [Ruminococcaceae bacterium]|nr:hydroxyethylthiazole kinase [Oscillospiraceae bacterium]
MTKAMEYMTGLMKRVRRYRPLVLQIANSVAVNDCANVTLAAGASPVMSEDVEDAVGLAKIASSLVLNMGTLNQITIPVMIEAGEAANERGIPVVFDPVGAGASEQRNRTADMILQRIRLRVLRGNLSEIRFMAGFRTYSRGVDVAENDLAADPEFVMKTAVKLAQKLNCVVAITGETDILSDGTRTLRIENGSPLLSRVTGTGCMLSSLIGSFVALAEDTLLGTAAAVACMGIAGELAALKAGETGMGSFRIALMDAISRMDTDTFVFRSKITDATA